MAIRVPSWLGVRLRALVFSFQVGSCLLLIFLGTGVLFSPQNLGLPASSVFLSGIAPLFGVFGLLIASVLIPDLAGNGNFLNVMILSLPFLYSSFVLVFQVVIVEERIGIFSIIPLDFYSPWSSYEPWVVANFSFVVASYYYWRKLQSKKLKQESVE